MGMAMSAILVPAFNQTMWKDGESKRALRSGHDFALLIAIELGMAALIYLFEPRPEPIFMVLVSLYQIAGVVSMFVLLGAMLFTLMMRRDASIAAVARCMGSPCLGAGIRFEYYCCDGFCASANNRYDRWCTWFA